MGKQEIKEIWVPAKFIRPNGIVLDFSGLYEVSDLGRVRSLNYHRTGKTKVMRPSTLGAKDGSIYYMVYLHKDNKRYYLAIHRLVLSSFKEREYFLGAICDHIDHRTETVCDNRLSNLRWFTYQQNSSTEHCREAISKASSKRVRVTDLTTCEVTEYPSAREAERALGMPCDAICRYIRNHNGYYKKLGLHFGYID